MKKQKEYKQSDKLRIASGILLVLLAVFCALGAPLRALPQLFRFEDSMHAYSSLLIWMLVPTMGAAAVFSLIAAILLFAKKRVPAVIWIVMILCFTIRYLGVYVVMNFGGFRWQDCVLDEPGSIGSVCPNVYNKLYPMFIRTFLAGVVATALSFVIYLKGKKCRGERK